MPNSPAEYFRRAQAYHSSVEEKVLRTFKDEARLLRSDAAASRTSRATFLRHFPLHYFAPERQPRRAVVIRTTRGAYDAINILPDYYTEDARVRDVGAYEKTSPFDYWQCNKDLIAKEAGVSPGMTRAAAAYACRELLWKAGPKEARQGKITNYLTLFSLLKSKIVLDPSAAWGDRLIAALASSGVQAYTGVDPHSRLPRGWREILDELGPLSNKPNFRDRFVMLNEPFEPTPDSTPLPEGMGNYDTVLVSTAPLFGDQYDAGNPRQAVAQHGNTFKSYVRGFLIPYLSRCIAALRVGGYLCMTVLDRARDNYHITELQLLLAEMLMGSVMHYRGVVWWEGDSGSLVPWWIFVKGDRPIPESRQAEVRQMYEPYVAELA